MTGPKPLSRLLLFLARRVPRGYWRLIRFAAERDPALWDYPLPLTTIPGAVLRGDLRESVFVTFLRYGSISDSDGDERLVRRLIAPGDRVFDVGGNIGYTMLLYASLAGEHGKVTVFEPGRRAFAGLARNAEPLANVGLIQAAASDHVGEAVFHETAMSDISSLEPVEGAVRFTVPTTTLDRVAEEAGAPDFVKIDVEGHEPAVLRGMAGLLGSARPPIVLFEALEPGLRDQCVAAIRACVPDARLFRLRRDGTLEPDLDRPGTRDYLFLPAWAEPRLDPS